MARAMIELAIEDFEAGRGAHPQSQRGRRACDATDWLFNPARAATLTFADACAMAGIDVGAARAELGRRFQGIVKGLSHGN